MYIKKTPAYRASTVTGIFLIYIDIFTCLFNIKPKYLGEKIDISGNGNVTND